MPLNPTASTFVPGAAFHFTTQQPQQQHIYFYQPINEAMLFPEACHAIAVEISMRHLAAISSPLTLNDIARATRDAFYDNTKAAEKHLQHNGWDISLLIRLVTAQGLSSATNREQQRRRARLAEMVSPESWTWGCRVLLWRCLRNVSRHVARMSNREIAEFCADNALPPPPTTSVWVAFP